jgi:3-phenylpropionate/trans-cinnamate dioxygenase ferredoxin reductase subunit
MSDLGLLVVGSGPGGVSAAMGYRAAGGAGPVRLVTADPDLPYERPPLSKDFLRGDTDADGVALHPEQDYVDRGIELIRSRAVRALSAAEKRAELDDGTRLDYRACVLATGSAPIGLPVPGADLRHVHTLRSLQDAHALRTAAASATRAVVAGSGFIGCEAAASLAARGLPVTLVTEEQRPHEARLGEWAAQRIEEWLRDCGVELVTGDRVAEISDFAVRTEAGHSVAADLVLLATGVRPRTDLARAAGLAFGRGRVHVDSSMRTSADDVYAVGDVAFAYNTSAGRELAVEHWGDAMAMGEIAGRQAAGQSAEWSDAPGFWSTIGDHTLKYSAWGDGFDDAAAVEGDGGFTVWYGKAGQMVGVLTSERDSDYDRGRQLVEQNAEWGAR